MGSTGPKAALVKYYVMTMYTHMLGSTEQETASAGRHWTRGCSCEIL